MKKMKEVGKWKREWLEAKEWSEVAHNHKTYPFYFSFGCESINVNYLLIHCISKEADAEINMSVLLFV